MRVAIIGGSGVYDLDILDNPQERVIETEYGTAEVKMGSYEGQEIVFLARHEKVHALPPHKINYRANIAALKKLDVERIIGTTTVGGINSSLKTGDLVLLDQFIDFTKNRACTFYDDKVAHTDMTNPYCSEIRENIIKAAKILGIDIHEKATYVCTEGPRFETSAEIKMFSLLGGDVIGMTNIPECVLARELGICYAAVAVVANPAAGYAPEIPEIRRIIALMKSKQKTLIQLLMKAISLMPEERGCTCKDALERARI
ncbi:MAG: S-methyl-5'-thioadenosine phosphorylase [Methanocellales archaeon]|nr:S-methyl-5'-thioadenosine phosphorylase [Methanocellales archaeon]